MLPGGYGNSYQIVQGPGFVAIRYEMVHETRVIPLDCSSPSRQGRFALISGVARGHWEGDTLVVETTNFKQRSAYRNANAETLAAGRAVHGGPSADQRRMVCHRRRFVYLDEAVDVLDAAHAERRGGGRVL